MAEIQVWQTNVFLRAYKRLHDNQKDAVDQAVADIVRDPALGEAKKGDLAGIYVYKFDCVNQLFLLAYAYDPASRTLLLVGTHENFYRNLTGMANMPPLMMKLATPVSLTPSLSRRARGTESRCASFTLKR